MNKGRFLISTLVMAGIVPVSPAQADTSVKGSGAAPPDPDDALVKRFTLEHRFLLAQHRSHSSHSSHSSHRSGSTGRPRAPAYTPPPPRRPRATPTPAPAPSRNERSTPRQSILPASPETAPRAVAPSSAQISSVVRQVQIALLARGYYRGTIDGVVGRETRAALTRFQTDNGFDVTGTITPETLDALGIAAQ